MKYTIVLSVEGDVLQINGTSVNIRAENGIVSIENYSTGLGHSCHPNIDKSGNVKGMIERGYWSRDDHVILSGQFRYNKTRTVISDHLDMLALHLENGYNLNLDKLRDNPGMTSTVEMDENQILLQTFNT